MHNRATVGDII